MLFWLLLFTSPRVAHMYATSELVFAAEKAARAAGEMILAAGPQQRVIASSKANSKDLLTSTDTACQEKIRSVLSERCPDVAFLGEEDVAAGAEASSAAATNALSDKDGRLCWVVDPIDGTANFVDGLPLSSVSIACVRPGSPSTTLVAAVFDPHRDEMFLAEVGKGTTLAGKSLRVSPAKTLADSIIYAGAPPNPLSLAPSLRGIKAVAPECRTLRLLGSAALMLAYVAAGRGAAYFEADLSAWDTAAGALLITEAGGKCTDSLGRDYEAATTRQIVASNGHIHATLLDLLNQVRGVQLDDAD